MHDCLFTKLMHEVAVKVFLNSYLKKLRLNIYFLIKEIKIIRNIFCLYLNQKPNPFFSEICTHVRIIRGKVARVKPNMNSAITTMGLNATRKIHSFISRVNKQ